MSNKITALIMSLTMGQNKIIDQKGIMSGWPKCKPMLTCFVMPNGGFRNTKPWAELGFSWGSMKQGKMCNTHCSKALVKMISTSIYKNIVVLKPDRNSPNSISANVGAPRLQKPQRIPQSLCTLLCLLNN